MHNSASDPTLYYGTSRRPLQIQPHSELIERFSLHPIISMPQNNADDGSSVHSAHQPKNLASSAPAPPEFESQDTWAILQQTGYASSRAQRNLSRESALALRQYAGSRW